MQITGKLLCSGRQWFVVPSNRKCIESPKGDHYILSLGTGNDESEAEKQELLAMALQLAPKLAEPYGQGRWRILLNGPAMVTRPTFHIHIVCVATDVNVKRLTDSIVE